MYNLACAVPVSNDGLAAIRTAEQGRGNTTPRDALSITSALAAMIRARGLSEIEVRYVKIEREGEEAEYSSVAHNGITSGSSDWVPRGFIQDMTTAELRLFKASSRLFNGVEGNPLIGVFKNIVPIVGKLHRELGYEKLRIKRPSREHLGPEVYRLFRIKELGDNIVISLEATSDSREYNLLNLQHIDDVAGREIATLSIPAIGRGTGKVVAKSMADGLTTDETAEQLRRRLGDLADTEEQRELIGSADIDELTALTAEMLDERRAVMVSS